MIKLHISAKEAMKLGFFGGLGYLGATATVTFAASFIKALIEMTPKKTENEEKTEEN